MYFASNIKYLRQKYKQSQQDLADQLGIPRTTLGDYERAHTEPDFNLLLKIARRFSIPLDELFDVDLSLGDIDYLKMDRLKVLTVTVDPEGQNNIEFVPIKAAAGYAMAYQDTSFIKQLPRISIPKLNQGQYRAFEINGDSMLPLNTGAIVICEYLESIDHIKDNTTYVVISSNEGVVYKRLIKDDSKQQIILHSDNSEFLTYTIDYNEVSELWSYVAHISFVDPLKMNQQGINQYIERIEKKIDALR